MCLILFAHGVSEKYPLVIVANRDEFYNRPTQPAQEWADRPQIIAGRDLRSGGTWMGISKSGRIAAVTNFRDPANMREDVLSRGELVTDFLVSSTPMVDYLNTVKEEGSRYNGFNLIVWDRGKLGYVSNYNGDDPALVNYGIHGLSNAFLDSPWPKVEKGKALLNQHLDSGVLDQGSLFELISNQEKATDDELPKTGIKLDRERALSSMFIQTTGYGTRNSSLVLLDASGQLVFVERNYDEDGSALNESVHTLENFFV